MLISPSTPPPPPHSLANNQSLIDPGESSSPFRIDTAARLISIIQEGRKRGASDDAGVTSLPVSYKYFALAAAARLINWVKKTLGRIDRSIQGGPSGYQIKLLPDRVWPGSRAVHLYLPFSYPWEEEKAWRGEGHGGVKRDICYVKEGTHFVLVLRHRLERKRSLGANFSCFGWDGYPVGVGQRSWAAMLHASSVLRADRIPSLEIYES